MAKYLALFISLSFLLLSGCCAPKASSKPELAYLVAYSLLDKRFNTSTRLDLTADILNEMDQDLELCQLTLNDTDGNIYTLDYETIPSFTQEGRYDAIPLKIPIKEDMLGGQPGIKYESPSGLRFLFMSSFESAVIKYRTNQGMQELQIKNLSEIITRSREETISWMEKEYEEREKTLSFLKEKADQKIAERKSKN